MKPSITHYDSKIFIDGQLKLLEGIPLLNVIHPATGEVIGTIPDCNESIVDEAVELAIEAQKKWAKNFTAVERGEILLQIANCIESNVEDLAAFITLETGKAIRTESRVEAKGLKNIFTFYGGLGTELKGETIPLSNTSLTLTLREPMGVVAAILPWNVPLMLMAIKIAPALLAGNAVVVKSSEQAPFSVLRLAEIINTLLPTNLLQVISGRGERTGMALIKHKGIAKVTFTGSVATGRKVAEACGHKLIPATLELGGKSPLIICEDTDIQEAVKGATMGMRFTRQGQSCTAASRIFIHERILSPFIEAWVEHLNNLIIGDPFDEKTDIGAIITRAQYDKIQNYITLGKKSPGASWIECSQLPTTPHLRNGLFIRPTIFQGLDSSNCLMQEEIFGPVVCVSSWNDFDEVLKMANHTDYGLAASIWTQNYEKIMKAIHVLDAGFIQINQYKVFGPGLSFGGFKQSGIGKEATLESLLEHFTRKKTVVLNRLLID